MKSFATKFPKTWIALLAICCLLEVANSKLRIERPDPLLTVFKESNGEIESQYANFGHIPYG